MKKQDRLDLQRILDSATNEELEALVAQLRRRMKKEEEKKCTPYSCNCDEVADCEVFLGSGHGVDEE